MDSAYNKIEKIRDNVIVSRIFQSKYQKEGTLTAELKQTVHSTVTYPPRKKSVVISDEPFLTLEQGKKFTRSKTFVAFLDVDEDSNIEDLQKKLEDYPNCVIYKVLSNYPILSEIQKISLESNEDKEVKQQYYDMIANRQLIVRNGRIVLDSNGKPQYLATFFSSEYKEDIDYRTSSFTDFYKNKYVETHLNLLHLNNNSIKL